MSNIGVMPFSGGMDSAVMLPMVSGSHDELHLLTFDYGQRHKREIECAKSQIQLNEIQAFGHCFDTHKLIHKIIDVTFIKDLVTTSSLTNEEIDNPDVSEMVGEAQPVSYVPFRNQIFLSIACAYAESVGAGTVYHGATKVDSLAGYWDGSPEFLDNFNDLVKLNRSNRIKVKCPLINMDKKDIVKAGCEGRVDFSQTYTCYSGEEIADATTPSSSLRIKGFAEAGYIDPQPYKQDLTSLWEEHDCKPCPTNNLFEDLRGTRGP
tara:strand:- start:130 stop:921 length:792 start_codon:yes stop_codon:yes gene_type:complete